MNFSNVCGTAAMTVLIQLTAGLQSSLAADFLNDGMKSGTAEQYFASTPAGVSLESGRLILPAGGTYSVASLPFNAEEEKLYAVVFNARMKGPRAIETFPQSRELFFLGEWSRGRAGAPLPVWALTFQDKDGKPVPGIRKNEFHTAILSSSMKEYRDEFIVPPGASRVVITFRNNAPDTELAVEGLKFLKVENRAARNVNPDFSLGEWGFAGWTSGSGMRRLVPNPDEKGKYRLQLGEGGYVRSDAVFVKPGEHLRLEFKGRRTEGVKGGSRLIVFTYKNHLQRDDSQTGSLTRVFFLGDKVIEEKYSFVVPDDIAVLRVYNENGTLDYLRIVEDSPEKAE